MNTALIISLTTSTWIGQAASGGCEKDTDCKGDRICVAGQCQAPTRDAPAPSGPTRSNVAGRGALPLGPEHYADDRLANLADSWVGIQADIGGFLCYGPAIDVEVGTHFAVFADLRAVGLGALRYAVAGDTDGVHNSVKLTDLGVGAGARYYFGHKANREGLYVGGLLEFVNTDSLSNYSGSSADYHTQDLLMAANAGYRWVFPSRMTLGLGAVAGLLHVLSATSSDDANGYYNTTADSVGGLLTLEIGVAL